MSNTQYAGIWIRTGAALIDVVFWIIAMGIPLTLIYGEEYWVSDQFFYGFWDFIFGYALPLVITVWFWLRYFGTPGKMLLKLKIVDSNTGNKLSISQAVGRYFAYLPAMLLLFIGIFWIGIDKKKQGWHDKLAGTVVIKNNQAEQIKLGSQV